MYSNGELSKFCGRARRKGREQPVLPGRVTEVSAEATFKLNVKGGVRIFQTEKRGRAE